jgi:hypothetical protein
LLERGVGKCPGPTTQPESYCSLIGEAMEPIYNCNQGQIPSSMIYDAVVGVIQGEITVEDIPDHTNTYPNKLLARWGSLMCRLDEIRFPEQHYDPAELLPGKLPQ